MPVNEIPTTEEIQGAVTAAFHSVDLINAIIGGTQMLRESAQEKKDCVKRNYEHLEIMAAKEWFADALTTQQSQDIDDVIEAGKAYYAA